MAAYEVERGGRIRVLDVNRIRSRLARGRLSLDAQVRPVGEPGWRAIRDVPELLLPGVPGRQARWNEVQGFIWNAGAWAILTFTHTIPPVATMFWGLAVALHGVKLVVSLASAPRPQRASLPEAARQPEALPAQAREAADPFLAELETAIGALSTAAGPAGLPPGVDLQALRAAAGELRRQHRALEAQADGAARERLLRERDDALAGAERTKDPRTAEVLRGQADSVERRLGALEHAADAAARLEARERTLLHQVESLRLSIVQSGVDEAAAPDLAEEVERLRLDLRASEELESDLARARLGARLGQRS
jgi:hypothetical protein